jgi:hypothetical protein
MGDSIFFSDDDEEDIYPNPDMTIEYAVNIDQDEGKAGPYHLSIFISMNFSRIDR